MTDIFVNKSWALLALIVVQMFCTAFFFWDVMGDLGPYGLAALKDPHIAVETAAALSLIAAVIFEIRYLLKLLRQKAHLERQVSLAAGAFHDIMQEYFRQWKLTPAEQDVANFTVKGMSITEIATLRGSAEGTVKSHLNGIYRKAGVTGRGGLLSLLIDDLVEKPLVPPAVNSDQKRA